MKNKYDMSKAPRELLEKYASCCLGLSSEYDRVYLGKLLVEATSVPLRTKAEVDADMALALRQYAAYQREKGRKGDLDFNGDIVWNGNSNMLKYVLNRLLEEETSD